jgi:hypothetical protein
MPAKPPTRPEPPGPGERPLCERGDVIYCRTAAGRPFTGKVLAHGEHGCTVENGGKPHKVRWEHYLGHRSRANVKLSIMDEGEDGFLAQDEHGRTRYYADPLTVGEEDLEEPLGKALQLAGRSRIEATAPIDRLLDLRVDQARETLAKAVKGGVGLSLQPVTDKAGHQTKRWKRNAPEEKGERRQAAAPEPPAGHKGAKKGDKVKFKAGDFAGEGTLESFGRKGGWVRDKSGRPHKVDWSEIAERDQPDPREPAAAKPVENRQEPAKSADSADKAPAKGIRARREAAKAKPDAKRPFYDEAEHEAAPHTDQVRQPHATWEDLAKHGEKAVAHFTSALGQVANAMHLRTDVQLPEGMTDEHLSGKDGFLFVAPLKSAARAKEKVDADYEGDWSKLKDLVRATISVSSVDEIHQAIAEVKKAGLELAAKPKDRFAKPTRDGYRDLTVLVKVDGGMLAELQFHLKHMTHAKNEGHKHYEAQRSLQAKYGEDEPGDHWSTEDHSAFYGARQAQQEVYGQAWKAAGGGT